MRTKKDAKVKILLIKSSPLKRGSSNLLADLRDKLLEADMAALVTPLYYFGMSAQLKMVIG